MPITDELKSINKLEEAGFSHEQAKAIVEIQEDGIQSGFDRFVEVLEHRLTEMEARMRADMQTLRGDLLQEQRDQMLKFAALVSLIAVITGAVVKLL